MSRMATAQKREFQVADVHGYGHEDRAEMEILSPSRPISMRIAP